jgi:hypothetical protein
MLVSLSEFVDVVASAFCDVVQMFELTVQSAHLPFTPTSK